MPRTLTHVLYDTAVTDTSAAKTDKLFQHGEGSDTTHVSGFTNMVGNGALPTTMEMSVARIEVFPEMDIIQAELVKLFDNGYVELVIGEESLLQVPLIACAARHKFSGEFHEATPSASALLAPSGPGLELEPAIAIPGGTHFHVDVAFFAPTTAAEQLKVCLCGTLTRPG